MAPFEGVSLAARPQSLSVDGEVFVAPIEIRNAALDDSEPIARLVSELGYQTSASQMRQRLLAIAGDDDYVTLVACDGRNVVGFAGGRVGHLYESDDRYGQIMALAVATEHQRRGIGRTLVRAVESSLVARGARTLVVTSGNQRADAHVFYERCGYAFTGRRYKKSAE